MCGQLNWLLLTICNNFTLTGPISHIFPSAPLPTPLPTNSPPGVLLLPYHQPLLTTHILVLPAQRQASHQPLLLVTLSQLLLIHPCL